MLVEKDGAERLYFVVETKSSLFTDDLRDKESAKIKCGKAHFKALGRRRKPGAVHPGQEHRRPDGELLSHTRKTTADALAELLKGFCFARARSGVFDILK